VELARGNATDPSLAAFRQMGELMYQSHWSYTECGLGSEATDQLIDLVRKHSDNDLLFGAKITGGGAGGTVAVLGSLHGEEAFQKVVDEYAQSYSGKPYVFTGSSIGADKFGIHVIQANR
jgi:galactokinase